MFWPLVQRLITTSSVFATCLIYVPNPKNTFRISDQLGTQNLGHLVLEALSVVEKRIFQEIYFGQNELGAESSLLTNSLRN